MAESLPQGQDEESAPLLPPEGQEQPQPAQLSSIHERYLKQLSDILEEPLTTLTRILLVACLILLLIASVFIGLFAGLEHRISVEKPPATGNETTKWRTATETTISTSITTAVVPTTTTIEIVPTPPAPLPSPEPEKSCMTADCIILSASILSSLNETQDPCENFYDFANGGWLASNPLPGDKARWAQFNVVQQEIGRIAREIIATPVHQPSGDVISHAKITKLFNSCMNESRLETIGIEPLHEVVRTVKSLYGHDPSESTRRTRIRSAKGDLTSVLAYLHSKYISAIFNFEIDGDIGRDPNFMVLWFYQDGLGLPSKEYYEEEDILELYTTTLSRLLYSLDESQDTPAPKSMKISVWPPWPWPPWGEAPPGENKTERADRLSKEVAKFERKLARAGADLEVLLQDPIATYNPVPLSNITSTIVDVHFPTYFSALQPRTFPETVVLTYPPYLTDLATLLSETDTSVLQAYFIARAGLTLAPYLSTTTEPWKAVRELREALYGLKKGAIGDREEWCLTQVEDALGFAVGRFYVEKEFGGNSRATAFKVVKDVVDAFKTSLPELPWMDEYSAKAAAEKASVIRIKVGYPLFGPNTTDANSVAGYYSPTKVEEDDFFFSMVSSKAQAEFWKWTKLGRRRDPEFWEMYPVTVNAYFNPPANEIVFPAGILRPPFFAEAWPSYLSYGAFGAVAAHELTHAFDSAGRLFNQEGKLEEWWTNTTSQNFDVLQECISKQYSQYSVEDGKGNKVYVNGNLTSGENIGDAGLIQAYRAWSSQFNTSFHAGQEYLLPGLNYTREQLFFISFGRVWATNISPAAAVQQVRTDPHSPARWRVDGTVRNIPQFAKAFNCSATAKLNPPQSERCSLWA